MQGHRTVNSRRSSASTAPADIGRPSAFAQAVERLRAGDLPGAETLYRSIPPQNPAYAVSRYHLGAIAWRLGRHEEAVTAFHAHALRHPDDGEVHANLAVTLIKLGRLDEAFDACRRAIALAPDNVEAHASLGLCLKGRGQWHDASKTFAEAIRLRPDLVTAHVGLSEALFRQGLPREAQAAAEAAIACDPRCAEAFCNLGLAFTALGASGQALTAYRRALELAPDFSEIHANIAGILRARGDVGGALAAYRAAQAQKPDLPGVGVEICALRQRICDWTGLAEAQAGELDRCRRNDDCVPPFSILTMTDDPAEQQAAARRWARRFEARATIKPMAPRAGRRLRVGYLSADFHEHSTATLAVDLFERHDRGRFEILAYSCGPDDGSALRRRVIAAFDRFVDIRALSHAAAAQAIEADGIDILVDLKGYTEHARTEILALRPAPVQVNFLGYPGTMGAPFIDYVIADPVVAPFEAQAAFDERIVHLPHCYQPNDRGRAIAARPSRSDCGLPEEAFVYCCLNACYKITPLHFDIWMRLLREVPRAVLWLLGGDPEAVGNLRREAEARGVDGARVIFAPKLPPDQHLARMSLADLFLDTLPVNAHTTASEALWAGLPMLTCLGKAFIGRVAASLLLAVDLPELIAGSLADYEGAALMLARNPNVLAALRRRLDDNRLTAPLFDSARFTRDIEAAFDRMADRHARGQWPEAFAVGASP